MGHHDNWAYCAAHERRGGWRDLELRSGHYRLVLFDAIHGRNGEYGTYSVSKSRERLHELWLNLSVKVAANTTGSASFLQGDTRGF
jgi:hypothetical protein